MHAAASAFLSHQRIAVVGVSRTRGFGNTIMRTLADRGYEILPINANADTIDGLRCFRSLMRVSQPVDAVVSVVPPLQTSTVVDDCIRVGCKNLWMQQGAESKEAIVRAEAAGISVVHHACILMYAQPTGIHKIHRWLHDQFVHEPRPT